MISALKIIYYLSATISLIAVLSQIIVIVYTKLYKKLIFEIILCFFLNCLLYTSSLFVYFVEIDNLSTLEFINNNPFRCKLQGGLIAYSELSFYMWSAILSNSIYFNIVKYNPNQNNFNFRLKIIYYLVGFFIPLIFTLVVVFLNYLGPSGNICWLDTMDPGIKEKAFVIQIIYYVFFWIMIFFSLRNTCIVIRYLKNILGENNDENENDYKSYKTTLLTFSLVPLIMIIPMTVLRTIDFSLNIRDYTVFKFIFLLYFTLPGLVYAIFFCINSELKDAFQITFNCFFCCCSNDYRKEISSKSDEYFKKFQMKNSISMFTKTDEFKNNDEDTTAYDLEYSFNVDNYDNNSEENNDSKERNSQGALSKFNNKTFF